MDDNIGPCVGCSDFFYRVLRIPPPNFMEENFILYREMMLIHVKGLISPPLNS